jgi:hypothetical protein
MILRSGSIMKLQNAIVEEPRKKNRRKRRQNKASTVQLTEHKYDTAVISETKSRRPVVVNEYLHLSVGDSLIKTQNDINLKMRTILLDWIIEVKKRFRLKWSTLRLAITILDITLRHYVTNRKELQKIGCTALWIASKYNEIYTPEVDDFVHISDRAYTRAQLKECEAIMVDILIYKENNSWLHFHRFWLDLDHFQSRLLRMNRDKFEPMNKLWNYFVTYALIHHPDLIQNLNQLVMGCGLLARRLIKKKQTKPTLSESLKYNALHRATNWFV